MSHTTDAYINLPNPHKNGWILSPEGTYSIDWEDKDVQSKVEDTIQILTKGCKCKQKCEKCGCKKRTPFVGQAVNAKAV